MICTASTNQHVASRAAHEMICTGTTDQKTIPIAARQVVAASPPHQHIGTTAAGSKIVTGAAVGKCRNRDVVSAVHDSMIVCAAVSRLVVARLW